MGEYSKEKEEALQRALFFMVPSFLFELPISLFFFQIPEGSIKDHNFIGFGWYRIILGAIVLLCGIARLL